MLKIKILCIILALSSLVLTSCKKLIETDPPVSTITTNEVFNDSADADAAVTGIYSKLINNNGNLYIASGALSIICGSSADELINFRPDPTAAQFYLNQLSADNPQVYGYFWGAAYPYIYQANACIEGLQASKTLSQGVKDQFSGEAKFIRAFCYFYLVNLFGDVPYISSTEWEKTSLAKRTPKAEIYEKILADLQESQNILPTDYSISKGERTRANKWSAIALSARVNLYLEKYTEAETQSSLLISNLSTYKLVGQLDSAFLANNSEAILQLKINPVYYPFTATSEGNNLIPITNSGDPFYYMSDQLLGAFEAGDARRLAWVNSTVYNGTTYYYPYKYKIGPLDKVPGGTPSEYYMVLRLAEQYLIRAEARAKLNNLDGAISDLNVIRVRSQLPELANDLTKDEVLAAIVQERRVELFAEWGHRWMDLKRTGTADIVLSAIKPAWKSFQQLYPIPQSERRINPNLTQNAGY